MTLVLRAGLTDDVVNKAVYGNPYGEGIWDDEDFNPDGKIDIDKLAQYAEDIQTGNWRGMREMMPSEPREPKKRLGEIDLKKKDPREVYDPFKKLDEIRDEIKKIIDEIKPKEPEPGFGGGGGGGDVDTGTPPGGWGGGSAFKEKEATIFFSSDPIVKYAFDGITSTAGYYNGLNFKGNITITMKDGTTYVYDDINVRRGTASPDGDYYSAWQRPFTNITFHSKNRKLDGKTQSTFKYT